MELEQELTNLSPNTAIVTKQRRNQSKLMSENSEIFNQGRVRKRFFLGGVV